LRYRHRHPRALRALRLGLLLPGLLGSLGTVGCGREPAPNLFLVTFDTTRYDRFGVTGDPEARTPVVDALAERGLLFERTYASTPLTLPSHTTMLTGLEPIAHGVHHNGRFRVADELDTLAEILRERGYDTAAFVAAFVLDPRYNLNQGFDVYSAETRRRAGRLDLTVPQRPGEEVTDEALAWLGAREGDAPFFLWAHYYDPHAPRRVEAPYDEMPDTYRAEIAYADAQLGRLLEGVERASPGGNTLIVFTADHGESLGDHGEATHGLLAYDSTLHVPLILAGRNLPLGARTKVRARHVDLLPTILTALRFPVPEGLPGRDLVRAVEDDATGGIGYFECQGAHFDLGWASIAGVRNARWKYTATPAPAELYDITRDPGETVNLAAEHSEVVAELAALFADMQASQARPEIASERPYLDPEEAEQLAALGYVDTAPIEVGEEPDPRRFIAVHGWVSRARSLASNGRYPRAIDVLETLAESHSVRALVLRTLAPVYLQAGRTEDSIRAYRDYIDLTGSTEARLGLARALMRAERPEAALAALDEIDGTSTKVAYARARALARLGRDDEARRTIDAAFSAEDLEPDRLRTRAALVIDTAPIPDGERELRQLAGAAPDDAALKSRLGFYLAVWGGADQREEAARLLREAAEALPDRAEILANLGWGIFRLGDSEAAREALEAAIEVDDSRQQNRVRLAHVLRQSGEEERALQIVRSALAVEPAAPWSDGARELAAEIEAELGERDAGARS
jgi:arylsulfatase A-like enzyme/Flp pilus assembly protein TadD